MCVCVCVLAAAASPLPPLDVTHAVGHAAAGRALSQRVVLTPAATMAAAVVAVAVVDGVDERRGQGRGALAEAHLWDLLLLVIPRGGGPLAPATGDGGALCIAHGRCNGRNGLGAARGADDEDGVEGRLLLLLLATAGPVNSGGRAGGQWVGTTTAAVLAAIAAVPDSVHARFVGDALAGNADLLLLSAGGGRIESAANQPDPRPRTAAAVIGMKGIMVCGTVRAQNGNG